MKQFGFERPLVFSLWKHSLLWNEQTHENLVLLVNVVVGPLLRPTLRTKNRRLVETRMNGGNKHAQTNDYSSHRVLRGCAMFVDTGPLTSFITGSKRSCSTATPENCQYRAKGDGKCKRSIGKGR